MTDDFEDIGHSDSARDWYDKYIIGVLEGSNLGNEKYGEDGNGEGVLAEDAKIPRNDELNASGGGGKGNFWFLAVLLGVAVAGAAWFMLRSSSN